MSKNLSPEDLAMRAFVITMIGLVLYVGASFFFVILG